MCEYESIYVRHKVGKLTGCDFCGFTFYFDNHLRFFDYSRVNLLIIFSLSFSIFHFHFLFWQPPSLTIHGWISLSCLFCSLCRVYLFWLHRQCFYCPWCFFQPKNNTHTDKRSQFCWHENLTIQQCDIVLLFFQWKVFTYSYNLL